MTDLIHALARSRLAATARRSPMPMTDLAHQGRRRAKEPHEARLGAAAAPLLDMRAYVEEFGRTVVPAYRRGVADRELPADVGLARSVMPPGDGRRPRLQPPRAADPGVRRRHVRRLHGLRQRLPGHGDPRDRRRRRPRSTARVDGVRGDRRAAGAGSGHGAGALRRTPRSTARCRHARASSRGVRHLRRPGPLQGLRRVRRGLRGAGPRRAAHDRQGRAERRPSDWRAPLPSRRSTVPPDIALLPLAAADARPSTATRRPWPT